VHAGAAQITIDGTKHELARPFVVLATQNPPSTRAPYPHLESIAARPRNRIAEADPTMKRSSGLRKRIGALVLGGVLGRQHDERRASSCLVPSIVICRPACTRAAPTGSWGGPVDLVDQDERWRRRGQDGTRSSRCAGLKTLVPTRSAGSRSEVPCTRAYSASERASQRPGERSLTDAGASSIRRARRRAGRRPGSAPRRSAPSRRARCSPNARTDLGHLGRIQPRCRGHHLMVRPGSTCGLASGGAGTRAV